MLINTILSSKTVLHCVSLLSGTTASTCSVLVYYRSLDFARYNDNDNEISFILTQVNTSLLATLLGLLCGIANTIT